MKPRLDPAPLTDEDCEVWLWVLGVENGHMGDKLMDTRQGDRRDALLMFRAKLNPMSPYVTAGDGTYDDSVPRRCRLGR